MNVHKYLLAAVLGLGICGGISVEFANGINNQRFIEFCDANQGLCENIGRDIIDRRWFDIYDSDQNVVHDSGYIALGLTRNDVISMLNGREDLQQYVQQDGVLTREILTIIAPQIPCSFVIHQDGQAPVLINETHNDNVIHLMFMSRDKQLELEVDNEFGEARDLVYENSIVDRWQRLIPTLQPMEMMNGDAAQPQEVSTIMLSGIQGSYGYQTRLRFDVQNPIASGFGYDTYGLRRIDGQQISIEDIFNCMNEDHRLFYDLIINLPLIDWKADHFLRHEHIGFLRDIRNVAGCGFWVQLPDYLINDYRAQQAISRIILFKIKQCIASGLIHGLRIVWSDTRHMAFNAEFTINYDDIFQFHNESYVVQYNGDMLPIRMVDRDGNDAPIQVRICFVAETFPWYARIYVTSIYPFDR